MGQQNSPHQGEERCPHDEWPRAHRRDAGLGIMGFEQEFNLKQGGMVDLEKSGDLGSELRPQNPNDVQDVTGKHEPRVHWKGPPRSLTSSTTTRSPSPVTSSERSNHYAESVSSWATSAELVAECPFPNDDDAERMGGGRWDEE